VEKKIILPVTTQMSTLNKSDRDRQLSWLKPGSRIQQDQDLINFIEQNAFKKCYAIGEVDYFNSYVRFVEQGSVDFCICIQTANFDLDDLIDQINHVIMEHISPGGQIYLAFNRYQIKPKKYSSRLSEDFDTAIDQYVRSRIIAQVDKYIPCGNDGGNKFNWIHPLTRFYLRKNQ
jgi:hypothetical protein